MISFKMNEPLKITSNTIIADKLWQDQFKKYSWKKE